MIFFVLFCEVFCMAENQEKRLRTKKKLTEALIELCEEKNYYDITIWDICNKAKLYRSTFYRYYETKDEMLREIEHEYLEKTRSLTPSLGDFRGDAPEEQMSVFLKELTADMEYHRQNAKLCRFLLSPAGDIYFHQQMIESVGATVELNIRKYGGLHEKADIHYLINYFSSGFISTIYEWLIRDDKTPEQIAVFLLDMMKCFRM